MGKRGSLHLTARGRRSADAPGIAQIVGEPLKAGEAIVVSGTASAATQFILDIQIKQRYQATFALHDLGLRITNGSYFRARIAIATQSGRPRLRTDRRRIPAVFRVVR
jgi:hypothetical protein